MNKKGFTLVELLGVLVIVAILSIVVVTPIIGQIRNNSKKLDEASLKVLYSSTASYLDEYKNQYPKNNKQIYYISIGQLIDSKKLTSNYLSSYSEKTLSRNDIIKINVEDGGYQYSFASAADNLTNLSTVSKNVNNDSTYTFMGGTYFKGNASTNYVYYSGFMWRIMGVNKDGSIKLITDEPVTAMNFGSNSLYNQSYVTQWLNDYFLTRLKYSDFIVDEPECTTTTTNSAAATDACGSAIPTEEYYTSVSQLSLYEYNLSTLTSNSYLKNSLPFSTLTYAGASPTKLYASSETGVISQKNLNSIHYIRPVINLKPESAIVSGNGTKATPYILFKDITSVTSTDNRTLNNLNLADGEYLNLNNKTYRVIENDSSEVKVILNSLYVQASSNLYSSFGSTSVYDTGEGIAYNLNNTVFLSDYDILNGVVNTKFWYQGEYTSLSADYKSTALAKTNILYGISVALPKLAELLTVPIYGTVTNEFWTMSKVNSNTLNVISTTGNIERTSSSQAYVRPVIVLNAAASVSGGNGTSSNPYVVAY